MSQTQPHVVRAGRLLVAAGASDPSLTIAEFTDALVLMLADGFEQDSHSGSVTLELVQSARSVGRNWVEAEHHRVHFDGTTYSAPARAERPLRRIGSASPQAGPVILFLSREDYLRLERSFHQGDFDSVIHFAGDQAMKNPNARRTLDDLLVRHRARRLRPVPLKKETVRLALPPRPAAMETIRLELPPGPGTPPGN